MNAKILTLDIETTPIQALTWGIWDVTLGLNQIQADWSILSFAAKWYDGKKVIYYDTSNEKDVRNDKKLCEKLWVLINDADMVVTQNGDSFDLKKIAARMLIHGLPPPSTVIKIDTKKLAKKYFGFTSVKLEYLSKALNKKYKKLDHSKFPGMTLWIECLKGNKSAFRELKKYNEFDVLSTEELYTKLRSWDSTINFSLFTKDFKPVCSCGSKEFTKNGYSFTSKGKYQRFLCVSCNRETKSTVNLIPKDNRPNLRVGTKR